VSRKILAPAPQGPVEPGPIPSFSVLIAAYQAADHVGEAVSSALDQTLPPHEVIVCDDGSTDDIEGALEPFRDRITLLRREHSGEGASKNAAARAASGDFVCILDADDIWLPERLEALGELAQARPDLDVLVTNASMEADGRVMRLLHEGAWRFDVDDQRSAILERNFIVWPTARRSRFLAVGGYDESPRTHNDWVCSIRLVYSGCRAGLVDEPLVRYQLHEAAMSSNPTSGAVRAVATLESGTAGFDLTPAERSVLDRTLAYYRRNATWAQAKQAVREGAPDARRRSLKIARAPGYSPLTRLKALAGALSPGITGRVLRRRERRWLIGAGAIRVPRR
jgi:glycosyltransferase involved in cell wall biosynthesis